MTRLLHRALRRTVAAALLASPSVPTIAAAQDTTFRGITLNGVYDPLHSKVGVVVLPVAGAFGDSVRAMISRDLDYSDRFTVIAVDSSDPSGLYAPGSSAGLNYPIFARLAAAVVLQITPVATGLHAALHDVAKAQVMNVGEFALPANALGRDWRLAVHRASDEIERWVTGQRGIAATRIAYMRGPSIRIVDSDGAEEITAPTEENAASPAWNPAGTMLVYTTFGVSTTNAASHVVLIDLTTGRSHSLVPPGQNGQFVTPVFTSDGASVMYAREGDNGSDLYSVSVGGGSPQQRTFGHGTTNIMPTMSPNGRRITFASGRTGAIELYIMDADGTNLSTLTDYESPNAQGYRSDPDWSPDGRLVAYQDRLSGVFQIRTIPAGGGSAKTLTSEGENEQPSWAPDSRHLVFTSNRTGVRQLWILDTESFRLRQLTKSAGSKLAAWSPRLADQ